MAGTSLDLAVAVTGHTRDVARQHYLRVNGASQCATISKLAEVYGLEPELQKRSALDLTPDEAVLLLQAITVHEHVLLQNSGAKIWNNPEMNRADDCRDWVYASLAERGGRPKENPLTPATTTIYKNDQTAKQALMALAALKARILEHVPEDRLHRPAESRQRTTEHPEGSDADKPPS